MPPDYWLRFVAAFLIVIALLMVAAGVNEWWQARRDRITDANASGIVARIGLFGAAVIFAGIVILVWLAIGRARGRDLDGRYAQSPTIAVLATICLDRCQDVVVTTSEQDSSVTMMWCAIGGQIAVTEWLAQNKPGYRLVGWKCVVGEKRRGA